MTSVATSAETHLFDRGGDIHNQYGMITNILVTVQFIDDHGWVVQGTAALCHRVARAPCGIYQIPHLSQVRKHMC